MTDVRALTHAGGIVFRGESPRSAEFLLITSRRHASEWIFPRGHIEPGETAEQAAIREVFEEAGVRATVIARVRDVERTIDAGSERVRYFLMQAQGEDTAREGRALRWLPFRAALTQLTFADARALLRQVVEGVQA